MMNLKKSYHSPVGETLERSKLFNHLPREYIRLEMQKTWNSIYSDILIQEYLQDYVIFIGI